jgi:hypothetical protein
MVSKTINHEQTIRFSDCNGLEASMNFGVLAPETLRGAECLVDSPSLHELQRKWSVLKVDLADLCAFEVTTNSTASVLRPRTCGAKDLTRLLAAPHCARGQSLEYMAWSCATFALGGDQ